MKWTLRSVALAATLLACASNWTSALAQPARVRVAAQGSDSNACTFAAPCRTFQHAHDVVAANGEIDVLDPAGYGSVIITKAISIQGHEFSGISVTSGHEGINVNASFNDKVSLRGLLIDGGGVGSTGIAFLNAKSLTIENCVVRNFVGSGIAIAASSGAPLVSVTNTIVADNSGHGLY